MPRSLLVYKYKGGGSSQQKILEKEVEKEEVVRPISMKSGVYFSFSFVNVSMCVRECQRMLV